MVMLKNKNTAKYKPLLEEHIPKQVTAEEVKIAVNYVPESHEVVVHSLRESDPNRLAEQAAGIGAVSLAREFRVPAEVQAEDEIQQRWNNYDPHAK